MTWQIILNRSSTMTEALRSTKLSYEDADRILQNILSACGMKPVPLEQAEAAQQKHTGKAPFIVERPDR